MKKMKKKKPAACLHISLSLILTTRGGGWCGSQFPNMFCQLSRITQREKCGGLL